MYKSIKKIPNRTLTKPTCSAITSSKSHINYVEDICERRHCAVITGVSFKTSEKSEYPDIVCLHYSYYDSMEQIVNEDSMEFHDIYTSGKKRFVNFCKYFQIIENGKLLLKNLIKMFCIAEYYFIGGKTLRMLNDNENKQYKKTFKEFSNVKFNNIENIPNTIDNYWIGEYDPTSIISKHLYGIITNVREKDNCGELEHIITVNVFIEGEAKKFSFYTNGTSNSKYQYLHKLCDGDVENAANKLEGKLVEVLLYEASTGNTYIKEIRSPYYSSEELKWQVNKFADMQEKLHR